VSLTLKAPYAPPTVAETLVCCATLCAAVSELKLRLLATWVGVSMVKLKHSPLVGPVESFQPICRPVLYAVAAAPGAPGAAASRSRRGSVTRPRQRGEEALGAFQRRQQLLPALDPVDEAVQTSELHAQLVGGVHAVVKTMAGHRQAPFAGLA